MQVEKKKTFAQEKGKMQKRPNLPCENMKKS